MVVMSRPRACKGPSGTPLAKPIHLGIYRQCGICVQVLETKESIQVDAAVDAVPVHKDCYAMVKKQCADHDDSAINVRIWAVAAFRQPWNNSQPLLLPHPMNTDVSLIESVATELGVAKLLLGLPAELVRAIQGFSERSLFWRFVIARTVAEHISKTMDQPLALQTTPLTEIADWKRGAAVTSASSRSLPPFITVNIDSDGIRSISRQSRAPEYARGRLTNVAYIFLSQDDDYTSKLYVHSLYGRCRFVITPDMDPPRIWETPTPPAWSACNMSINEEHLTRKWPRLTVANLEGITGITFFLIYGGLAGIHLHSPGEPSAMDTFNKLPNSVGKCCVWNYVPISKGDRITGIGVKRDLGRPFNILIQTEKSGPIIVGSHNKALKDGCFVQAAPQMLVYQQPQWWGPARELGFLGTYSAGDPAKKMDKRDFPDNRYESSPISMHSFVETIYFSWAPLENVASAVIYRGRLNGVTRGVVLHYHHGGSRALGHVRVGVDLTEEIVQPIGICYKIANRWNPLLVANNDDEDGDPEKPQYRRSIYSVRVEFQTELEHQHPHGEWWCCEAMENNLKFWSMVANTFCIVRDETDNIPSATSIDLSMYE
ncbi:hypothetical protein TRIATDRAFT_86269 [Trichoderma atroviride IMI 206040]|uniref:Uncharacterized protein n=1 Tax=Hypocrea atroviridis (strain ATCC 20476 / IMI 206040) TaxID=452589 RepID=G9P3A8_HYPAI|nr:uncharacterized protein TRIATDRAFT_86269 [Trichoderma atroviride IMI 206040]EHK42869.1 hypothetical protein TRIATDRAFT_86269 [Trichoderma atroviride IMI 206040]